LRLFGEGFALLRSDHLTELRELGLANARARNPHLVESVWRDHLEVLQLRNLPRETITSVLDVVKPGTLRVLRLSLYPPEWHGPHPLSRVSRLLSGLEVLELDGWDMMDVIRLLSSASAPRLWSLTLHNVRGGRSSRSDCGDRAYLAQLLGLPIMGQLRRFELSRGRLSSHDLRAVAKCALLTNLLHLGLRCPDVRLNSFASVVSSPYLRQLRWLDLGVPGKSAGREATVTEFVRAVNLPHLGALDLSGRQLSLASLKAMLRAPWLNELHLLRLGWRLQASSLALLASIGPWERLGRLELGWDQQDFTTLRRIFGERLRY
jgi:hypothetical protein